MSDILLNTEEIVVAMKGARASSGSLSLMDIYKKERRFLIKAELKKVVEYLKDRGITADTQTSVVTEEGDLWLSREDWEALKKEVSK